MKQKQEISDMTPEQIAALAQIFESKKSAALESFLEKQNRLLEKRMAEEEEKERVELEQRKQGAKNMEARRQEEINKQNNCPHIKPNRATALAGQRDHSQNVHYVCQLCSKEWTNDAPAWLLPDPIFIGGPIH